MLIYKSTKNKFVDDVRTNQIDEIIEDEVQRKLNRKTARNEVESWKNSLQYMMNVLIDDEIPAAAGVAIEYKIPRTNNRIDFILTGKDSNRRDHAIVIELKQWSEAEVTQKDAIVKTFIGKGKRETNHPSYQAWSYASMIHEYNETVRDEKIELKPCAYLHNMRDGTAINDDFYQTYTTKAPVFLSRDAARLSEFLKRFVKYGDSDDIMYRIDNGKIKPSKNLADSLVSMISGNQEFLMIDEQKLVYETAIDLAHKAVQGDNQVLIVKGGPGTGKSVVAINLLVELTKREMLVQYVSKNAAPRAVFSSLLTGTRKKTVINNMFKGSGSYIDLDKNEMDVLVVDEAHRLNEKSGLYGNLGDNQIKELISCSKLTIFFIDEAQRVTIQDIGSIAEIENWATTLGSKVTELELRSQFRCNGSDGYLSWIDNTLQIDHTANQTLDEIDYEVTVFDDPKLLHDQIIKKNRINNKARTVAGYCWDWVSKKDSSLFDIEFPEYSFRARWNLNSDGSLWVIAENSVHEIGCIHTCQGLEVDYIGVIIGEDFIVRDGEVTTNGNKRSKNDRSIRGFKKLLKHNKAKALEIADQIIKNTYRTLMSRGQKGCYLYCVDKETNEYFKQAARRKHTSTRENEYTPYLGLIHPVVSANDAKPYNGYVPVFDLAAAAGDFSDLQYIENSDWVKLPEEFATREGMFVIRVVGESMNKRIPNGSWCLFKASPGGTRNNKIVLVQHREIEDPDHGGSYTVKRYQSEKVIEDGIPINEKIILNPETSSYGYQPIIIDNPEDDISVIGEYLAVL